MSKLPHNEGEIANTFKRTGLIKKRIGIFPQNKLIVPVPGQFFLLQLFSAKFMTQPLRINSSYIDKKRLNKTRIAGCCASSTECPTTFRHKRNQRSSNKYEKSFEIFFFATEDINKASNTSFPLGKIKFFSLNF